MYNASIGHYQHSHFEVFYTPVINNFEFIILLLKRTCIELIYGSLLPSYQDSDMAVISLCFAHELLMRF
jgi:hypothetical protein